MNTQTNTEQFGIYVADLAAYNEGRLIGRWLVPSEYRDADELEAAVKEAMSNANNEHAIHDSENVRISEHESLEVIIAIARACEDQV